MRSAKYTAAIIFILTVLFAGTAAASQISGGVDYGSDFGQKVINWIAHGTDTPTWGQPSLLSTISFGINAIGLFVMAWLAVIGGANFVIQTANKGVPGGQVISSFWMPIRVATATIMLIPLSSGYSTLQYGVITVAEKGNEHGNYLMGIGLDYLYDFGVYRSPSLEDGRNIILSWVDSEVCRQYINSYTGQETIKSEISKESSWGVVTSRINYAYQEPENSKYSGGERKQYCGSISFSVDGSESKSENSGEILPSWIKTKGETNRIVDAQVSILKELQPKVSAIARSILHDQDVLKSLQSSGSGAQSSYENALSEVNGKISGAVSDLDEVTREYNSRTQKLVVSVVNDRNGDSDEKKWTDEIKSNGWPTLGSIFWKVNINQSEINKAAAAMSASYSEPSLDGEWLKDERLGIVSNRLAGLRQASGSSPVTSTGEASEDPSIIPSLASIADAGTSPGILSSIKGAVADGTGWIVRSILQKNSPDDLILNLQYFGSMSGAFADALYWTKVGAVASTYTAKEAANTVQDAANSQPWWSPIGWGARIVGGVGSVAGEFLVRVVEQVGGLINYIVLALILIGVTLGIILPTIPLTLWFMGVISWILFFIECLLISPIWMSAHGTAERDGWGSEHTRQGYMLMIGLYLNPILRVAGFFAIFLAMKPLAWMVAWYIDYVRGVLMGGFAFLYIFAGSMIVIFTFSYTVLVRVFTLPSELFERGLRWVNGGQEVTGDSHSEEKSRGFFAAFGSKSETAAMQKNIKPAMPSEKPKDGK